MPPGTPSQGPAPGTSPPAQALDLELESLGKPKGVPIPVTIGGSLGGLVLGTVIGAVAFSGGKEAPAASAVSVSAPPPPASSGPPPPPPKSVAEKASEGDAQAIKELQGKSPKERTGEETIALFRGELMTKRKELEELARKTELVAAFGKSDDTQKKFMEAAKDPRQATMTLEIMAGMSGPMGPDYLYKIHHIPGRHPVTEQLAFDLLHSKDVYDKASDALKIVLDMDEALDKEEKDCQGMIKLLVRAQADADTRAFRPIASLNRKRGCGDNKLKDCWECLRDGDGKKALNDAVKLARKNKAPL